MDEEERTKRCKEKILFRVGIDFLDIVMVL